MPLENLGLGQVVKMFVSNSEAMVIKSRSLFDSVSCGKADPFRRCKSVFVSCPSPLQRHPFGGEAWRAERGRTQKG